MDYLFPNFCFNCDNDEDVEFLHDISEDAELDWNRTGCRLDSLQSSKPPWFLIPYPPPPPPPLWVTSPSLKFPLLDKTVIIFNQHITFYNSNDAKECKKMSRSIPFQTNSFTVFFNIIT